MRSTGNAQRKAVRSKAGAGGGRRGPQLAFGGRGAYPGTALARAGAVGAAGSRSSVG